MVPSISNLPAHRKFPLLSGNERKCFIQGQEELVCCEAEGSTGQGSLGEQHRQVAVPAAERQEVPLELSPKNSV